MPTKPTEKLLCVDALRHAEYYGMQEIFDNLYAKSANGEMFTDLMSLILSRENILLAYRNIKSNDGSNTPGVDRLTIKDIGKLTPDVVVERVRSIICGKRGYIPRTVRRVLIPKTHDPTKLRPLGIPCIWDRLIQQCIKQVMEPICEAKFSNNSYGFRPQRSVENAIQSTYNRLQHCNLHYVIEFDIKSFFDEVNHSKLIKQIWSLGIRDKHLIYVIRQILKAPIRLPNGNTILPEKGTPQGGIISPLLANIVLNELDRWVESQWEDSPHAKIHYKPVIRTDGQYDKSGGYRWMREKVQLKEMYIVRYADDFRIFCRDRNEAQRTMVAVTQWLEKRLRLQVSQEKTRIVNVRKQYSEFLGFKIKMRKKSTKYVVESHISDKKLKHHRQKLKEQAKIIANPRNHFTEKQEIQLYNSMVMGIQNYSQIATGVSKDLRPVHKTVMTIFTNRLRTIGKGARLKKCGRKLTTLEKKKYGKTAMLRFVAGSDEPIYPIGYVQHKNPMQKRRSINQYTPEGRRGLHDNLRINSHLMCQLLRQPQQGRNTEFMDNRISLFSAQWGKCAVTGKDFMTTRDIHCHHKIPKSMGGTDKYQNLMLVLHPVHILIHATDEQTICQYLELLKLDDKQLTKVNDLRKMAGNAEILVNKKTKAYMGLLENLAN